MAIRATEINPLNAIAEYLHISQNNVEKQAKMLVKKFKKKGKPDTRGKSPKSLNNPQ